MSDWTFTDYGSRFDTHVAAHLPGYADVQRLVALVAQHVVPPGGIVADLGCSTGKTAETIADLDRDITFHLYDSSASMLDKAKDRYRTGMHYHQTELPWGMVHHDADLTTCLWLLQFLTPHQWNQVLSEAHTRSRPTGCLLVAAKTQHSDPRWEQIAVAALDDYKADAGVSPPERADKTRALRGVLYPASPSVIANHMLSSGWFNPTLLWRWHVWSVVGAWASPLYPEMV